MPKQAKRRPWSWERHLWGQPTTPDVVSRRAGGRRRRNAEQQRARFARRQRVVGMMHDPTNPLGFIERGWQSRTARELGVGRATICRDVDAVLADLFGPGKDVGGGFRLRITCRMLRALLPTPHEQRIYARLGIPLPTIGGASS